MAKNTSNGTTATETSRGFSVSTPMFEHGGVCTGQSFKVGWFHVFAEFPQLRPTLFDELVIAIRAFRHLVNRVCPNEELSLLLGPQGIAMKKLNNLHAIVDAGDSEAKGSFFAGAIGIRAGMHVETAKAKGLLDSLQDGIIVHAKANLKSAVRPCPIVRVAVARRNPCYGKASFAVSKARKPVTKFVIQDEAPLPVFR